MTTALYRRYRPETFAEVIGQEHVTVPLMQALKNGRINHAYLFSGPRGCGKTTSARILARCLNCAQGPTDVPCGVCPSCVELARGGPGSLDVVEIDAASHGGVDDARDLRERATFAPARDRYKIFILDEAHMVTPQGFNALLKIVEEPPEHVMFVFATTEPDKVIGTIRSRTHHYPFRLVPPDVLGRYLEELCAAEGVPVGAGVLPLVIRAGAGSVRDSLSVLDQLVAGADEDGLDYERAVDLLGYTHSALLDDTVEAVAANDGASAFRVVERVISTGHEPRRFVEDLLERLRDLIVLAASGDAAEAALRDVPGDQLARMRAQATHLGSAELSRAADLVNAALGEMSGATSPRLHLELLVARLLLPAADDALLGHAARLDRLERGAGAGGVRGPVPVPVPVPVAEAGGAAAPAGEPALGGASAVRSALGAGSSRPAAQERSAVRAADEPLRPSVTADAAEVHDVTAVGAPGDGRVDAGPVDARSVDAGSVGAGSVGAGSVDAGPVEAGPVEAGPVDAGSIGAGPVTEDSVDAGSIGAGPVTAGSVDAGAGMAVAGDARPHAPTVPAPVEPAVPAPVEPAAPAPVESLVPAPVEPAVPAPAERSQGEPSGGAARPERVRPESAPPAQSQQRPRTPPPAQHPASAPTAPAGVAGMETEVLRRRWPEVLETLSRLRKVTWAMVSQNAQVGELTPTGLTLLFPGPGLATAFRSGPHADVVQRAVRETLGFDVRVEGRVGEGTTAPAGAPAPAPARPSGAGPGASRSGPMPTGVVDRAAAEASWAAVEPPDDDIPEGPAVDVVPPDLDPPASTTRPSARAAGERAHAAATRRATSSSPAVEDSPSPDDPDLAGSHLTGPPLVARLLGGTVIDEQVGDEA